MSATDAQVEWAVGGDIGISSLTIWSVMTGLSSDAAARFGHSVPLDPGDFGRCYRLLQRFPEWRERIGAVAFDHPHWMPLIDHWDELERLYVEESPSGTCPRLYERMKALYAGKPERSMRTP